MTPKQAIGEFLMDQGVEAWEASNLILALGYAGYVIVPREPTPKMLKECKGALYRYITALSESERERVTGKRGGYRVDQRTKAKVRWQAMLAAALEAEPCFKAAHPSGESDPAVTPDCHGSAPVSR